MSICRTADVMLKTADSTLVGLRSARGTVSQRGTSLNFPRRHGGMASELAEKSCKSLSHCRTPAVWTMINLSSDRCVIHQLTSLSTHHDCAASGEAIRI